MKALRHLLFASVLTCALAVSTLAGEGIVYPDFAPPPPPPPTKEEPEDGDSLVAITQELLINFLRLL